MLSSVDELNFVLGVMYNDGPIRKEHLLVLNTLKLPSGAASDAIREDPGLRVIQSWDSADDRTLLFAQFDASCAFCGLLFELDSEERPVQGSEPSATRREPEVLQEMLSLPPARRELPARRSLAWATCPYCGWRSSLSRSAEHFDVRYRNRRIEAVTHAIGVGCNGVGWHPMDYPLPTKAVFEVDLDSGDATFEGVTGSPLGAAR